MASHSPGKLRHLTCCCCGEPAGRWQQHWNRDTGYGICADCVTSQKARGTSDAEILDYYGREGINWGKEPKVPPEGEDDAVLSCHI